ncbi:MAG: HAMP domain-containing sensor histidine kinase [Bacteroidota bacterium]
MKRNSSASKTIDNRIFWRISFVLLLLLILLGVGYVSLTAFTAQMYLHEVNQKLHRDLAAHTVQEVKPQIKEVIDTSKIQEIMHSMMVINPSVEVYLLDTVGNIITYVAPYKKVVREKVDLTPVRQFIANADDPIIMGDDPRNFECQKVFSAAPILENDRLNGYVYIILASEEQQSVWAALRNSYMLKLGANASFVALLGALAIGLLAIWLLTRNLRKIIATVRRFKDGDYQARIPEPEKGNLNVLSLTFNEMADQINSNIEKIQSVEKLRRELIANVSHDLRTPLAIMQGYIETMIMKENDLNHDERRRYLNIVLNSSEKLSKLIGQLFEYSKLEAREITPKKEPFLIAELAQDVVVKYEVLAKEKNIELALDAPQKVPLVFADVALVERVIQNLVDNALKFTPKGGKVSIQLSPKEDEVVVSISDTGPGIPQKDQEFIFERFHQANKIKEKSSGAGLGLAIAKKILDIHNSTIKVISRPNEGASFVFDLPAYQG